jgi:tetratricopeptide (TPR) repeat protein
MEKLELARESVAIYAYPVTEFVWPGWSLSGIYKNKKWRCLFSRMNRVIPHLIFGVACSGCVTCWAQTNAEFFFNAGRSSFDARNYAAAITNFTKAVELNPQFADAYCCRGMSRWWLHDYSGAVIDYDKAIILNPKCGGYYCNRGQAKFTLKQVSGALADYNKSIELDPRNAEAYFNRGTLKMLATNYTEAVPDFTKAIELHNDPHEEDIWLWRGEAKFQLKDYAGAIADYSKSLELNPNSDYSLCVKTNLSTARELLRKPKQ